MRVFGQLQPAQRRNLGILFVAGLLFWASLSSLLPTLPLYVRDAGGTSQQVGWVMGAFSIGLLAFRPALGRLADGHSRQIVLLIGMGVVGMAPIGYWLSDWIPWVALVRAFHGVSIAAFATAYVTLVVDFAPEEKRGEILGYMSLVNPIGAAIGPALGGFLQEFAGYGPSFLFSALLGKPSVHLGASIAKHIKPTAGIAMVKNVAAGCHRLRLQGFWEEPGSHFCIHHTGHIVF